MSLAAGALTIGLGGLAACADGEAAKQVSGAVDVVDTLASNSASAANDGIMEQTSQLVCETDRKTLQVALEAYYAMNGAYPNDESELVTAGFLRAESEQLDVLPGGIVQVAPTSSCTA